MNNLLKFRSLKRVLVLVALSAFLSSSLPGRFEAKGGVGDQGITLLCLGCYVNGCDGKPANSNCPGSYIGCTPYVCYCGEGLYGVWQCVMVL